jgi:hypothetical protein
MKVDGACYCGHVRYRAEVDPAEVEICHCTDCQTLSGSAFRIVVPAKAGSFELLSGTLSTDIKTAESGNRRVQAFCGTCGTSVYSTEAGEGPGIVGLRVGTIRQRNELPPQRQYWTRSAHRWAMDIGRLEKVEKQ